VLLLEVKEGSSIAKLRETVLPFQAPIKQGDEWHSTRRFGAIAIKFMVVPG
jgi:hypothetical protein